MKYFDFSCPFCQQQFSIASELEGESFKCPTCERNFVIKSIEENFDLYNSRKHSYVNNAIPSIDTSTTKAVIEEIKQLKSEITRQTKICQDIEESAQSLNTMFSWFFFLWSLLAIIGYTALIITFYNIDKGLNIMQKIYRETQITKSYQEKF